MFSSGNYFSNYLHHLLTEEPYRIGNLGLTFKLTNNFLNQLTNVWLNEKKLVCIAECF